MSNIERPSRRAVLTSSAAAVAAVGAATAAGCTPQPGFVAPDPILVLAARFHREHDHYNGLPAHTANDENDAAWQAWVAAAAACYASAPQTLAGALAFVNVMIDREEDCVDNDVMAGLQTLRAGLPAMVAT